MIAKQALGAAPGVFQWDLSQGDAVLLLGADGAFAGETDAVESFNRLRRSERARRARFATRLERAGDAYLVRRDPGKTIDSPLGTRWITTLRKLPKISPRTKAEAA